MTADFTPAERETLRRFGDPVVEVLAERDAIVAWLLAEADRCHAYAQHDEYAVLRASADEIRQGAHHA